MNPFKLLKNHSKNLFTLIQDAGPLTKKELARKAQVKLTSLNRAIKPLIDLKLIEDVGIDQSSGGRKPIIYDVVQSGYYVIGIDLSRTYYQVVIINMKAKILGKKSSDMAKGMTPNIVIEAIGKMILELRQTLKIDAHQIIGIGLGTVGPMSLDEGRLLNPKKFPSKGWEGLYIVKALEAATGYLVIMENGANTAIFIEQKYGIGKACTSLAYFNCGIGIRTSVMKDNQVIRNKMNHEDTFAHMVVDLDGEQCSCGKFGCIEGYATLGAIEQHFNAVSGYRDSTNQVDYMYICEVAQKGDDLAIKVLDEAAMVFATGLSNFISILGPELIILSGPLIQYSQLFYEQVVSITTNQCQLTQRNTVEFHKQGAYKQDAISVGAAMYVIDYYL